MVVVRRLTPSSPPGEVDAAVAVLTTSFAHDQLARITSGPIPGLHAARMRSTLVTGVLDLVVLAAYDAAGAEGDAEAGEGGGGGLLGVLILKPPGVPDRASPNADGPHDAPVQHLLATHPAAPTVRENYATLRSHVHQLKERTLGGITGRWFVSFLGVLPAAQGKGVGRSLCDAAAEHVRAGGGGSLALVAIGADAAAFYARVGFESRGMVEFSVGPETVRRWAMVKEC